MNTPNSEYLDDRTTDFRAILIRLWQKRLWLLLSMFLFTAIFTAAAFLVTPVYRSSAVLVAASSDRNSGLMGAAISQFGGLASLVGINAGSNSSEVEETLAVLRSRQFTEDFIKDNNLLPKLFYRDWDATNNRWRGDSQDQPSMAKAYKFFNKNVRSVLQDRNTSLITLQIDWSDRKDAAAWVNQLVERINEEMRRRAITQADASLGFLESELKQTSLVAEQEAINRLIEAQIKARMFANVTPEYAFRFVDRATMADKQDAVWPVKPLFVIGGLIIGIVVGCFIILLAMPYKKA